MAVTIRLEDDVDIRRGDMLCRPHNSPEVRQNIDAKICWMDESSVLQPRRKYGIKHTTRWGRAMVQWWIPGSTSTHAPGRRRRSAEAQRDRPRPAVGRAAVLSIVLSRPRSPWPGADRAPSN